MLGTVLAVDSIVVLWFYEHFNFNESYFTIYLSIHPFFAPKIADMIILYAHNVLNITSTISINLL